MLSIVAAVAVLVINHISVIVPAVVDADVYAVCLVGVHASLVWSLFCSERHSTLEARSQSPTG